MRDRIILCQPGNGAGCSACCGLFNLKDMSRENLASWLGDGRDRVAGIPDHYEFGDEIPVNSVPDHLVRDRTSHLCPFQGFLSEGQPGCLIHPFLCGRDRRDASLFGKKICDEFLCPAHAILSEEEKRLLIDTVRDWYLYSVAVIDPESFLWMRDTALAMMPGGGDSDLFRSMVLFALEMHGRFMADCDGPVFFYSIPEYDLHKKKFSLPWNQDHARDVQAALRKRFFRT